MRTACRYILIFLWFTTVSRAFRLYNTKVSERRDYKDCLYLFKPTSELHEWQLVPYCIRRSGASHDDAVGPCHGNANYTFERLKSENINSHHLYRWNAAVDTMSDYQKYLAADDLTLVSRHYCNCSGETSVHIVFFVHIKINCW